jgi:hypothetical protein
MRIDEIEPGQKQEIDGQVEQYMELVATNCSDALNAMKQTRHFLYRGYMDAQSIAFKGASRNNRRPLSFDQDVAEKLDELFDYEGIAAKRSNSIFVSSDMDDATFYTNYTPGTMGGPKRHDNVYMIFPINGFNFSWARKTSDLFGDWSPYRDTPLLMGNHFDELTQKYGFTDQDFISAVRSGKEILISGQYYAFNERQFGSMFRKLIIDLSGNTRPTTPTQTSLKDGLDPL